MLKQTLIAAASVLLVACNNNNAVTKSNNDSAVNTLTSKEKKEGWELLFDGKSYKGWHKFGGKPVGSAWIVDDNSIFLDAKNKDNWQIQGGGDIVTDEEFDNFHLKMDWKIDVGGNSGIIFFIHEDSTKYRWPWQTGPEMQVLDNERHADAKIKTHRAGDLYDLLACSTETVKPALEWNHAEIIANNGKLDLYLNGVNVVSTTMWDDNWKKMVAASKFKGAPDFGVYKKGRIGLQDHGDNVWFRNVKIKRLTPKK